MVANASHDDFTTVIIDVTTHVTSHVPSISRLIICACLFAITIITLLGNVVVLAAFSVEKKLRTNFTIYIANLAITDINVAVFAMSFYTFDVLLGYWPFGEFMCGLWIFFDYGMTFASVFTLVAISVDRFWSVTWSLHYRSHNNKKKVILSLAIVWVAVLLIWLPPCIYDRLKWSEPGVCKWEPSNNKEFVVFVAIVGHHMPCLVLVYCYIKVYLVMQKRTNAIKPKRHLSSMENSEMTDTTRTDQQYNTEPSVASVVRTSTTNTKSAVTPGGASLLPPGVNPSISSSAHVRAPRETKAEREKKIFTTLSYIIFSYLICWVPFHVVFDISAINPNLVPELVYTITFWLTYFNSTLNPFLYAFSSKEFRNAFGKVIRCYCCRRQSH